MDNKGSSAPGQREGTTTAAASTAAVPAYVMDAIYGAETGGKTKAEKYDESINKYVDNTTLHIHYTSKPWLARSPNGRRWVWRNMRETRR